MISLEQRLQKTELVIGVAFCKEDLNFFIADGNSARLPVVTFVRLIFARRDFDRVQGIAWFRWAIGQMQRQRFAVRGQDD